MAKERGPYAKSRARRQAVLDAALAVFSANGYRGGALGDVAREVGLTKSALAYYFPTKQDLFTAVLRRRDDLAWGVSPLDQQHPVDALYGLVRLAEHNVSIPGVIALHTITAAESVAEDHPAHEYYVERYAFFQHRLVEILGRCGDAGVLASGVDPERAARMIAAMMDGLQIHWLLNPDGVDVVGDLKYIIDGLLIPGARRGAGEQRGVLDATQHE